MTAVDDNVTEGLHFVSLHHAVSTDTDADVMLSDNSVLSASDVLVSIYDDDYSGVIVKETGRTTSVAEVNETEAVEDGLPPEYFQDCYEVRLSKGPDFNRNNCSEFSGCGQ